MRYYLFIAFLGIAMTFAGCGIGPRLATLQDSADNAIESGDYQTALNNYEEIIELKSSRGQEISGMTYYNAGITAWEVDQTGKAVKYLTESERKGYTTEITFYILSQAYRNIDNLSLEISSLENYVQRYPEGEYIDEQRKRLFETYLESNNLDLAMELWEDLGQLAEKDPGLLENYFILNNRLKNEEELKEIAERIYSLDSNNKTALKYLGEHYFWLAENRYNEEMKAYENNHTRSQYRILLNALDEINEQFRMSRDYLERLWEIEPSPGTAVYLRNIYFRFGNEEKAEYFHEKFQ